MSTKKSGIFAATNLNRCKVKKRKSIFEAFFGKKGYLFK